MRTAEGGTKLWSFQNLENTWRQSYTVNPRFFTVNAHCVLSAKGLRAAPRRNRTPAGAGCRATANNRWPDIGVLNLECSPTTIPFCVTTLRLKFLRAFPPCQPSFELRFANFQLIFRAERAKHRRMESNVSRQTRRKVFSWKSGHIVHRVKTEHCGCHLSFPVN